jgi:hypothetical protein
MFPQQNRRSLLLSALVVLSSTLAQAQGLKTIDNPGGGQVLYGSITGQNTPQGAMASILHYVHTQFGGRPVVTGIFQSRDGQFVGASFTETAASQGNKAFAGLAIVSLSADSAPAGALLYDEAARFPKTQPVLMKKLDEAWHEAAAPDLSSSPGSPANQPAAVPPLQVQTGGDSSASIGLPEGWRLTAVRSGSLSASGPHGEEIDIGQLYQGIVDPRAAQNQRYPAYGNRGGAQITAVYGTDLFNTFVRVLNQHRQNAGLPPATFQLINSKPVAPSPVEAMALQANINVDLHDGVGPRVGNVRVGEGGARGSTWSMRFTISTLPQALGVSENPTLGAILSSYRLNEGVITGQYQQQIANIKKVGEAAKQQAADADARRQASSAAFNAHMDNIDRMSKAFQNVQFNRTEIQDNDGPARGAIDSNTAAALIKADPNRYEEVPTAGFLKGWDF